MYSFVGFLLLLFVRLVIAATKIGFKDQFHFSLLMIGSCVRNFVLRNLVATKEAEKMPFEEESGLDTSKIGKILPISTHLFYLWMRRKYCLFEISCE